MRPEKVSRGTKIEGFTDVDSSFDLVQEKAVLCSAGCCANTNMLVERSIAGSHQSNLTCLDLDVFCRGSAIIRSLTTAAGGSDDDVRHRDPRWRAAWSTVSAPARAFAAAF